MPRGFLVKRYHNHLPQEVPLELTKSSFVADRKSPLTPSEDDSPSALDLRCPRFIFHFPERMPSSAPSAYQRNVSALVSRSPNDNQNQSLSTSKKRNPIESTHKPLKRHKVVRKLNFDEHKSSPVSGTFIRDSDSEDDISTNSSCVRRSGDIDPSLNVVVITAEAKAEIAKIENKIGDYICALCKERYADAFGLAQHRCSRIVHVEYRCPECDKVFNCPANLASHRRWHKPRNGTPASDNKKSKVSVMGTAALQSESNNVSNGSLDAETTSLDESTAANQSPESADGLFECDNCFKKFRRSAYLKKHLLALHNIDIENNKPMESEQKKLRLNGINGMNGNLMRKKQKSIDFTNGIESKPNDKELIGNDFQYRCLVCGVLFGNEIALDLHNQSVHTNRSFACRHCFTIFFTDSELSIHLNKFHSNNNSQPIRSVEPDLV